MVIRVVKKGQFLVIISVVKKRLGSFGWLLRWLKRGSFGWLLVWLTRGSFGWLLVWLKKAVLGGY